MKNSKALCLITILLGICLSMAASEKLSMHIDYTRFLNDAHQTILQLDYQAPYKNLIFLAAKGGFLAELETTLTITKGDSLLLERTITDNIGLRNKYDTASSKSYLNRISLLLDNGIGDKDTPYQVRFVATDLNSKKVFDWSQEIPALTPASMISDIELCTKVQADTTQYLAKFKRGNVLFQPEPSAIFFKHLVSELSLYFEVYASAAGKERDVLFEVLVEHGEDLVYEQKITGHLTKEREGLSLKIPLEKFKPGIHKGFLSIQTNDMVEQRYFDFVIAERIEKLHFALTDPEEEIQLIKIFGTVRIPTDWKNMNLETKKTVISQAWQTMAANASLQPDDLIFMISDRIDHCNKNFSHFDAGWKTDMGRIYIRNGAPDDIEKDQTGDDTRFVRKDIQIWKYQKQKNAAYVFVDVQMSGNFKLIYVVNDPMENSHPDWLRYLGESFDTDRLKQ